MKDSFLNRKFKYTYSNACMYIIIVNVLVYFLTQFTDISYMGLSLQGWLSLIPSLVNKGFVWQLFTYMFVHQNYMHLFFNMFALLMFGRALERELGTREFLLFYIVCGFLAGVASYVFYVIKGVPEFFFEGGQIYYYVNQGAPVLIMGASGCIGMHLCSAASVCGVLSECKGSVLLRHPHEDAFCGHDLRYNRDILAGLWYKRRGGSPGAPFGLRDCLAVCNDQVQDESDQDLERES